MRLASRQTLIGIFLNMTTMASSFHCFCPGNSLLPLNHWIKSCGLTALSALTLFVSPISAQAQTSPPATAAGGKTELLWLGQAGFRIKSPGEKTIVIDPWLSGGPKTPAP
jgi:hypothetical protein